VGRHLTYLGIFLVAMATLMLEILLTRITSCVAWYHLAFFVISLAMLGMTAGAVLVFLSPAVFPQEHCVKRMTQSALAFAVSTPLAVGVAMTIPLLPVTDLMQFLALLAYGGTLAVPFLVSGVTLTLALTRAGLPPGTAYGIDLCGAAAGCILVIPILDVVDAPSAALLASAAAGLSAVSLALASRRFRAVAVGATAVILGLAVANAARDPAPLRPLWVKGLREDPGQFSFVGWNTYSRVTVGQTRIEPPVLWAEARNMPPELKAPIPQRTIKIDGAAATLIAALDVTPDDDAPANLEDHAYLAWDITSFAHLLRSQGPAAVVGVGGGRDVLEAVRCGHHPVVGVELNELIVDLHRNLMSDFSGLSGLDGVELVVDEARSFMTRDDRSYSVITMSLIDTWASTGAGAYALSENGLYTVEGWLAFMRRLEPDGIFTVSRWYKPESPGETARMLALAMETLYTLGAERPVDHIILLQNRSIATLLASPTPFTPADLDLMQNEAVNRRFNMLLTPRKLPLNPMLRDLAGQPSRADMWSWASSQELDLTPPTDARPFFFNMLKPATWLRERASVDELDLAFLANLQGTQTLVYAIGVSLVLTLAALVLPMSLRRSDLRGHARLDLAAACGYFALIGLGFMFVEMGLLSRLNVFLGHPTLALAVLLGGVILFTGIGSLLSSRVPVERRKVALRYPLVPGVLVVLAGLVLDPLMSAFSGSGAVARVVVSLAIIAPPALGLGLGFPLGLRLVTRLCGDGRPDINPWMWGINGACGVVASGLALGCSMVWGISATLIFGACCYLALPLCTYRLARS